MSWNQEKWVACLVASLRKEKPGFDFGMLRSALLPSKECRKQLTDSEALSLSVLEDGIRSYLSQDKRVVKEAGHWVYSDRSTSPFSFAVICRRFGFEARVMRQALKHLRGQEDAANQKPH